MTYGAHPYSAIFCMVVSPSKPKDYNFSGFFPTRDAQIKDDSLVN